MCWEGDRTYFCDWNAPRTARGFCADYLHGVLGRDAAAGDAVTTAVAIVSELITNSVQAGCQSTVLRLVVHRDHVRIGVADDSPGEPVPQQPQLTDNHGRGLQIVDRLAAAWGVSPRPPGKEVWAVLPLEPELTEQIECAVPAFSAPG
jgi:anti-sigma regulatory factor (Ser/Thr protein kinase)